MFEKLAMVEAKVHGVKISDIHFHEVGAIDSIVDIVAVSLAIYHLNLDEIIRSKINVGDGSVKCDHGIMPVPAPATAILLKDMPIFKTPDTGELPPRGVGLSGRWDWSCASDGSDGG